MKLLEFVECDGRQTYICISAQHIGKFMLCFCQYIILFYIIFMRYISIEIPIKRQSLKRSTSTHPNHLAIFLILLNRFIGNIKFYDHDDIQHRLCT